MTGLCASMDQSSPEEVIRVEALKYGLVLNEIDRRAMFEFLEEDQPGVINEDWIVYSDSCNPTN